MSIALLLLAAALVVVPAGHRPSAVDDAGRGRARAIGLDPSLPLTLDLAAAALRAGQPLAQALELAAPAARPGTASTLRSVATLSRLGAEASQAWAIAARAGPLQELAAVAVRSASSGIRLADAFERLASRLRAECGAAAAARAQRAGVWAMAPLAVCFLPAFVCVGVVPVVVSAARAALDSGL
jgi:Flp pilus assembly protein TadB